MTIRKEIFVMEKRLDVCIDITYGTDMIPIELEIMDYKIPEGATAVAYASKENDEPKKISCNIVGNAVLFTPNAKFFEPGDNKLQIRVTHDNKNLFTYICKVRCQNSFADEDVQEEENQPTLVTQLLTEVKRIREINIEGIKLNDNQMITHFGTCSTSSTTAAKKVAIENFELVTGARIVVKFTTGNIASSATLNVNSTGAKAMRYRNSSIGNNVLASNGIYEFVYDGTYWQLIGSVRDKDIDEMKTQISNINNESKWIQLGNKQTGKRSVTMPDLTRITDIMIIANINAANADDTADNAVMLQVHFPVLTNGLPLTQNRLRAGYYQDGVGYGGLVQFVINTTAGTISLERATLNAEEENTTATTTWTVYYKYNSNL